MIATKRAVLISMAALLFLSCGDQPDVGDFSVQNIKADPDESVVSFQFDVSAGTIQSVSHIPIGWQVDIDDDPSWKSRVKGISSIGAANLAPDEFKRLVFTIRRNESTGQNFNISGMLQISKTFGSRKALLNMQDFSVATGN